LAFRLLAFGLFGVLLFAMAYLTQLKYGRDLSAISFVAGVFASVWALSPEFVAMQRHLVER
jgi:hypothetical protein